MNKEDFQTKKENLIKDILKDIKKDKPKVVRKSETSEPNFVKDKEELHRLFDAYLLGKILKVDPTETKFFKDGNFSKDFNTSDFENWIAPKYATEVIETMFLDLKVASLFPRINMPKNPFKIPRATSQRKAWLKAEGSPFNQKLNSITGNAVVLDAPTIMTAAELTDELNEDSVVPLLPMIRQDVKEAIQYSVEDAIINGDTSGTFDADTVANIDSRLAWDGLRIYAHKGSYDMVDLSTFSTSNLLAMRSLMGKYGVNPNKLAWIVSVKGYSKFLSLPETMTMDKYGPKATILTGEQGKFLGSPIIVSEAVREDLNDTGVYDGTTTTYTEVILVYTPAFVLGTLKDVRFEPYRDPSVGNRLYASIRADFQPRFDSEPTCVIGVKVS